MDDTQKQLKRLIKRRHPEYKRKIDHWRFLESTYEGGRDWFAANIFRYYKEGDTEFKQRLARAYRFNHTREVVDLVDKYLFKMDIERSTDAPESIQKFWKSATLNGLSIRDYAKKVSRLSSIFGRMWIVVDTTNTGEVQTKEDEAKLGARVYSYAVKPENVLDFSYGDDNKLNWILIHEQVRDDDDPLTSSGELQDRYRLWERGQYTVFKVVQKAGEQKSISSETVAAVVEAIRSGEMGEVASVETTQSDSTYTIEQDGPHPHSFGEVPVFPTDNVITDEVYTAPGMIDDIAYLDRAVANYLSNLDAIIQDQTFSQLVIPAQSQDIEDTKKGLVELGTKRIFSYNAEGGAAPQYISPDVKQAGLILSAISKIINEIYHTAGLAGERTKEDNSQGIDNSSGVAKAYDFERVNSMLAAKADALELFETNLMRFVAQWNQESLDDERRYVSYPDNFDVRSLYDEFEIAARLSLIEAPDMIRRVQMKTLVKKMFPQIDKATLVKIEKEIDEWPPELLFMQPPAGEAQSGDGGKADKNRSESFKDAKNSLANKLVKESGK